MIPLKSILQISTLIYLYLTVEAISVTKNFEYQSTNPMTDLDWPEIYDNNLLIKRMTCGHSENAGTLCSLSEETYALDNSSKLLNNRSCTFDFMNYQLTSMQLIKFDRLNEDLLVYDVMYRMRNITELLFRENLVILRKVQIVDMRNCELIAEIDIKDETRFGHRGNLLVRPDDSGIFDIFYSDSKLCENSRTKIAYNASGKIIDGPVCYMNEIDFSVVEKPSEFITVSEKNFFLLEHNIFKSRGYLISYDGNDVESIFKRKATFIGNRDPIRISTDYDFVTICRLHNSESTGKAICSIIDFDENEKVSMNLFFPYKIQSFEILNLENGDILSLIGHYEEGIQKKEDDLDNAVSGLLSYFFGRLYKRNARNLQLNFEIRRYSRNGTTIGESIPITDKSCGIRPRLIETNDDKVCVSFSCKKTNWSILKSVIDYQLSTECVDFPKITEIL